MLKKTVLPAILIAAPFAIALFAQATPDISYDANADPFTLPANTYIGEVAGAATNSKGHVFVYARTGHAVATRGDERTFYHNGSRLFQFDQNGKFVKEIGQGLYAINFAQQVRVDPQDNIWIVDAGSNMVVKFDADGRTQLMLGRKPENITLRPGPGVPASGGLPSEARGGAPAGGGRGADAGRGGEGGSGGANQYLYTSNSNDPESMDHGEIYKVRLNGQIVGKFGKAGKMPKEFGMVNSIDCRTENDLWLGEVWNWRAQKITLRGSR